MLQELQLVVKAGMPPEAAFKSATSVAARHNGREKEIGTLARGMTADILIVRGNPLENMANIIQIDTVIQGGKIVFGAQEAAK